MALFLVQHGISAAKEVDPEKGLADEGRQETQRIAEVLKGYGVGVEKIVHSGKKRALQTAEIYHAMLQLDKPMEVVEGIAPLDDVKKFAATVNTIDNCLVVGHLPFMQHLVSYLTTGNKKQKIYQFQNSGVVCLEVDKDEDGGESWFIKWTINPQID